VASYNVVLRKSVTRDLQVIAKDDLVRVMQRIGELASNPFPDDAEKLSTDERYRVRVNDVRIVYEVARGSAVVIIVAIHGAPPIH
jgi:mRNA interferase RelE/StbE